MLPKYRRPAYASARSGGARSRAWRHGAFCHRATRRRPAAYSRRAFPLCRAIRKTTLSQRVLIQEHIIYPLAVNWFCQGRLRCEAGKARLDGRPLSEPVQISDVVEPERPLMKNVRRRACCWRRMASADCRGQQMRPRPTTPAIAPFIAHYRGCWKGITRRHQRDRANARQRARTILYTWTITAHGIFRIAYQRRSRADELVDINRRARPPGEVFRQRRLDKRWS